MEFLEQLEFRHRAFIHSGLCGKVHILDGTLSKKELLAKAIEEIGAIRQSKSWIWRFCSTWISLPIIDAPHFDKETQMRTFRMILGPLPSIFARTIRGQYPVAQKRRTLKEGYTHTSVIQ